jgi:hypothetical protein
VLGSIKAHSLGRDRALGRQGRKPTTVDVIEMLRLVKAERKAAQNPTGVEQRQRHDRLQLRRGSRDVREYREALD